MRTALLFLFLAGCGSSAVGAECAVGYVECGGQCVDVTSDTLHCGACGVACAACDQGMCIGPVGDAGVADAAIGWAPDEPPPVDRPRYEPPALDIGAGAPLEQSCALGSMRCGGECVRPDSSREHCGGCGVACGSDQVCAGGACADVCAAPRTICGGACVDPSSDPDHCGACGNACPTGVCSAGACMSAVAGHAVLVGHDYVERRDAMRLVAGNAVFLGRGSPARVLVYEGDADPAAIAGTEGAIAHVAALNGRAWTRESASAEVVPVALASADVLVIHAQTYADDAALDAIGAEWSNALRAFLRTGGVVVAFEGDGGASHRILTAAGIMIVGGRADATGSVLQVVSPADALALGVPLSYRGERTTVRFVVAAGGVVADAHGPVVVHYTVLP